MDKTRKEQFWAELDLLGEDKVRENIGLGLYGEKKKEWTIEWLRKKDQERSDERDRSNISISLDSLKIARSAKNAAWAAIVIAIIAIIVSIFII